MELLRRVMLICGAEQRWFRGNGGKGTLGGGTSDASMSMRLMNDLGWTRRVDRRVGGRAIGAIEWAVRAFKHDSLIITFAVSPRLDAIVTDWPALIALDSSSSTSF